jgi:hypothetical protein
MLLALVPDHTMRIRLFPLLLLPCLAACHEAAKPAPDATPSITPMGLASAVTLLPSTNAVDILTKLRHPTELVLGPDGVVVLDSAEVGEAAIRDVVSIPLTGGGSPKTLFSGQPSGGATFVLARDQREPVGLAVDDRHVYWTNLGDGTVCRTDKTPQSKP